MSKKALEAKIKRIEELLEEKRGSLLFIVREDESVPKNCEDHDYVIQLGFQHR